MVPFRPALLCSSSPLWQSSLLWFGALKSNLELNPLSFFLPIPVYFSQPWCAGCLHASVPSPAGGTGKFISIFVSFTVCLLPLNSDKSQISRCFRILQQFSPKKTFVHPRVVFEVLVHVNLSIISAQDGYYRLLNESCCVDFQENCTPQQVDSSNNSSPYSQLSK